MKIKNDETIVYGSPIIIRDGALPVRVVIRKVDDSSKPFITHMENMRLEDNGNTWVHESFYYGHYFMHLKDAEKDFDERIKSY